ncbi:MAG: helix-turn-helix domain-containing protein [Verrucomicrobiota bacterium]
MKKNHGIQARRKLVAAVRRLLDAGFVDTAALVIPAWQGEIDKNFNDDDTDEDGGGLHSHEGWELFCVLRGDLHFECADLEPGDYPAGSLLLLPPGALHKAIHLLPQPDCLEVLILSLSGVESTFGMLTLSDSVGAPLKAALSHQDLANWTERLGQAPESAVEQAANLVGSNPWRRERALAILRMVYASCAEALDLRTGGDSTSFKERVVAEALHIMQTNYFDPNLKVGTIAESVGVSASHLTRLFKEVTGKTMYRSLQDLRLKRATGLLESSDRSIKEIAALTGWSNQLYFSAAFRRHYGIPPSEYRKRSFV